MRIATHINVHKAPPGRHNAAPGLYLIVTPRGRRWAFRYIKPSTRKPTEMGLGPAELLTLAEARDRALDHRRAVAKGLDPIEQRREQRRAQTTFAEMANAYLAIKKQEWRSERSHHKTCALLSTYAKALMAKSVNTITADNVEAALRPLWDRSRTQGRRTLSVICQVFDYTIAMGCATNNPADWRIMKRRFPKVAPAQHFTAMDYTQVPAFMKRLHGAQERPTAISPFVIEFLILTACRTSEVTRMRWEEIDWEHKLWIVPPSRTKSAREHRVPLSDRALELLKLQTRKGDYVWKGRIPSKTIDSRALYRYLTRSMKVPVTIHGFRSSFRDFAGNETHFDRVTCELALAHRAGDATELAYRRSDALEKRRKLMQAWADYCEGEPAKPSFRLVISS